ncbi:MAG TPA: outer membrane beta-barrel protein [Stellaceae bacterium]|jgi:opacity protein-like surface antigen|nr:outer membrane beta-barrel protein [Stellaceae bacterium]
MRRFFQSAAVAALLLGVAPFAAEAQTVALPHGLYAGVDAGVIVPQSISIHGSQTVGGTTATFNGDLNFETGAATGLILGWHMTPFIALEGNFEYAGFDTHSLNGTVSVSGVGSTSGSISVQGHLDMYNGLMNAIWSPLGAANWHGISPYIGAGVGFSHIDQTESGIGGASFGSVSQDETDFAANGIVGFDVAVMPQLTLGARYRLLYVNTASDDSGVSNGDLIGHVITANATWHF